MKKDSDVWECKCSSIDFMLQRSGTVTCRKCESAQSSMSICFDDSTLTKLVKFLYPLFKELNRLHDIDMQEKRLAAVSAENHYESIEACDRVSTTAPATLIKPS